MSDVFDTIDKINKNINKMRKSIKKINVKLAGIDLSHPNEDEFDKIASYFDDIKCLANRSMIKMDHLIDNDDDSSDLSSLSDISINNITSSEDLNSSDSDSS